MNIVDVVLLFVLLWLILLIPLSVHTVNTGQIRIGFLFGKFYRAMVPGLRITWPWPIVKTEDHSTQTHQIQFPADDEFIDRERENPDPGKRTPYRVIHKGARDALYWIRKDGKKKGPGDDDPSNFELVNFETLDDTDKKIIVEDSVNEPLTGEYLCGVEWNLEVDEEKLDTAHILALKNFIRNVIPERGSNREEEIFKRMDDYMSRILQEIAGPLTFGHTQERIPLISTLIRVRLEQLVGEPPSVELPEVIQTSQAFEAKAPWGIHIRDAYIKNGHPGRRVNEARADAAAALSKRNEMVRIAEGEAKEKKLHADADAYEEIRKGQGEAGRITAMAKAMDDPNAKFLAALDVTQEVAEKAKVIIAPEVGGLAAVIASVTKGTLNVLDKE